MPKKKDSFRSLLARHARYPERIGRVMRDLNPFFTFADAESYPLEDASRLRKGHITHVIAKAIAKPVDDVLFVSRSDPFPRPLWMTDDAYRIALTDGLRTSLGMDLRRGLVNGLSDVIDETLQEEIEPLREGILTDLTPGLILGLTTRSDDPLLADLEDIIEESIVHLLGLTLFCNPANDDRLRGLIRLLPKAIPLGERADDPAIWLVLTA